MGGLVEGSMVMPGLEVGGSAGLLRQMLGWIEARPRRYGETMDAWRTSCPRLSVWEDALAAGLVRTEGGGGQSEASVLLTAKGAALLVGG